MALHGIPYLLMRGGTSRGPYFRRDDLPEDRQQLSDTLIKVIGSRHPLNIDGIGGGVAVTTKVAMLSKSTCKWADIDYFFAQVKVDAEIVDYSPTCGNMLVGVAPAAIEMGLIDAQSETTTVKIRAVNTGAQVIAKVETPKGQVNYTGEQTLSGIPGSAAPIELLFSQIVGSKTGALLPTGSAKNLIHGIHVTCVDVAMPMVIARAEDFGLSGYESVQALNQNRIFFERMEALRIAAGELMGFSSVAQSVVPKFAIVSAPRSGGTLNCRYFMPWETHPTVAVTGAQCLASCALLADSVMADRIQPPIQANPCTILIEHPAGTLEVRVNYQRQPEFSIINAGLVRTARKIADGTVYIEQLG